VPGFGYLTTSPAGTLAFGNVDAGGWVSSKLTVKNLEPPVGSLSLTAKMLNGYPNDFSVTGGNCTTIARLAAGQTCTYKLKLVPKGKHLGAVNTNLRIVGTLRPGVCPAGDTQTVWVTLSGYVQGVAARTKQPRR
jgi:hypothetical protein